MSKLIISINGKPGSGKTLLQEAIYRLLRSIDPNAILESYQDCMSDHLAVSYLNLDALTSYQPPKKV